MLHLYAMPSDDITNSINQTTQSILTTTISNEDDAIAKAESGLNVPQVASTIVFSIAELVTCGGLLLIFTLRRNTAKHASMIMISTLANICIGAISDLALRLPLAVIKESNLGLTHPKLCMVMTLTPDYFMIAILFCLPLLSIERLIRLEAKHSLTAKQTRHLFGCLLVVAYSMALVVIILPTTHIFSAEVNSKCNENLLYGYAFSYVYSGMTALSVLVTMLFSVVVIFRLKAKLSHLGTTMRKKIILKQGTMSAVVITGVLFLALVPFCAALQLVLLCGSNNLTDKEFCKDILPNKIFRGSVIIQKLCLVFLPLIFLGLNPNLRRKIWLTLKKPKKMENVVTISSNSMTVSRDSICEPVSCADDLDDDDFITIAEDLTFGKNGDVKGEIKRRSFGSSIRHRASVLDLVEVLSVISERSEISRTYSNNYEEYVADT